MKNRMVPLLLIVVIFFILGAGGFVAHGVLATFLIVFAFVWLIGGFIFHGARSGWYGGNDSI